MAYQRRPNFRQRGYTGTWDKLARLFKVSNPLCLGCLAIGRVEPATVVDHIEPHRNDQIKFWDEANWQPSCKWHHDQVKRLLEDQWERGEIGRDALRLDSREAIALTRRLGTWVTVDGWTAL